MARWRLPPGVNYKRVRPMEKPLRKAMNLGETLFMQHCIDRKLPLPVPQYKFALSIKNRKSTRGRQWRFDFAWPDVKVAVEIDGGVFINGAHGNPLRLLDSMVKMNYAALLGWSVLHFLPNQVLRNTTAIDFTLLLLEDRLHGAKHAASVYANTRTGMEDPIEY